MALLSQYSIELRYFSPTRHALVAIAKEGIILLHRIHDTDWIITARKKENVSYEEWIAIEREDVDKLPAWATEIDELPSLDDIQEWISDGVCPTPTGDDVEPDGHGPDGAPSWLLALGLI